MAHDDQKAFPRELIAAKLMPGNRNIILMERSYERRVRMDEHLSMDHLTVDSIEFKLTALSFGIGFFRKGTHKESGIPLMILYDIRGISKVYQYDELGFKLISI